MTSDRATIVRAGLGEAFDFGGFGVRWKIDGSQSDGRFAVVHHPLAPRTLAAPLHRHHREDEFSFVLKGTLGALLGEAVVEAEAGAWVFKPRGQWHTFWSAGDAACEIIEVISPAGFENYFRDFSAFWRDRSATGTAAEVRAGNGPGQRRRPVRPFQTYAATRRKQPSRSTSAVGVPAAEDRIKAVPLEHVLCGGMRFA